MKYEADKALEVCLKSSLQCRGSVRVYKMADGADSESQMYVYVVILHNMSVNSPHLCFRLLCRLLHCCFAANR